MVIRQIYSLASAATTTTVNTAFTISSRRVSSQLIHASVYMWLKDETSKNIFHAIWRPRFVKKAIHNSKELSWLTSRNLRDFYYLLLKCMDNVEFKSHSHFIANICFYFFSTFFIALLNIPRVSQDFLYLYLILKISRLARVDKVIKNPSLVCI